MALPALVLMLGGVAAPIGGSHVFRQAHVAANIDKFVEDGLSLRPSTYNGDVPFPAFDFPLYQLAVAGACRLVPIDPLAAARVASLLLFVTALGVYQLPFVFPVAERTRGRFRSMLVFTFHPEVEDLLTELGAKVVAAGHHRALFRLGRVPGRAAPESRFPDRLHRTARTG